MATGVEQPRAVIRAGFDTATRIQLLENDADGIENQLELMNQRLSKILATSVGILVSLVTTLIMLVLNLVVNVK